MEKRFQTFTVLIAKISRAIRRIKTEEMAEWGLKSPHVSCLYYLCKEGEMTAKELCDLCDEDKAAVSRSILFLEKNGYLTCRSDAPKRYKAPLSLTERGREVGTLIAEKIDRVLEEAGAGLSEADRAVFYQSLGLICVNLQKICQQYEQ